MKSNVRIEKITLHNYRNHKFIELELDKNIILISGKNGSGKTNILESISLFNSTTGLKKTSLKEIVRKNMNKSGELFGVNLVCRINEEIIKMGLGLGKSFDSFKKIFNVDGIRSKDEVKKYLNIFWVVPKTTFLFQNSPEERRKFIDQMILSTDKNFKKFILLYEKYKKERMKILKRWSEISSKWLKLVEQRLASSGIIICDARRNFIKQLNLNLNKFSSSALSIKLNGEIDSLLLKKPAVEVEDFFVKKLEQNRKKDLLTGKTNFSANQTDLIIYDSISGSEAKTHSTGEQKMIIFSLIFSFIKSLENKKDFGIIFLLDDVFSFLDRKHVLMVLEKLNDLKVQTLITDVRNDWVTQDSYLNQMVHKINIDDKRFKVFNNNI